MISSCKREDTRQSDMKLLVLLSVTVLVVSDFAVCEPEPPTDSYSTPEKGDSAESTAAPIPPAKHYFELNNFYQGAFPPTRFPPSNFLSTASFPSSLSTGYPLKTFNYTPLRQGILPPISQILPPQISQIVPPISQIIPPIFSNPQPALPLPPSIASPQPVPLQLLAPSPKPLINKYSFPQFRPLYQFPSTIPSLFSFPSTNFFPLPKQPPTAQKESLPTSYGPPSAAPEEPPSQGPAETSAAFEPSSVSYPYEPALPEEPEPAAPHKPAQEYGPPSSK